MSSLASEPTASTSEEETLCPSSSDSDEDETHNFKDNKSRRVAIAFQHAEMFQCPPKEQWPTIAKTIIDSLFITHLRLESFYIIFQQCNDLLEKREKHAGERKSAIVSNNYANMIDNSSSVAQIIADASEEGHSERQIVAIGNQHLQENGDNCITRSQVRGVVNRMNPVKTCAEKAKQGSTDPDSPWSKARCDWILQLLVRFRCAKPINPPPCHDPSKVTKLSIDQVGWWDEKHRKVEVSSALGRKTQTRFHRDEDGRIDPNGTLAERKTTLHVKHADEVRFCFGVAMIEDEGVRLPPFEHTCKKIVLQRQWEKLRDEEFKRAQHLTGKCAPWFQSKRPPNTSCLDDVIIKLKGIGKAKGKKLSEAGVHAINDVVNAVEAPPGWTNHQWENLRKNTPTHLPPSAPPPLDHRKANNPCLSLCGDCWEEKLKTSSALSKTGTIRDLVTHVHRETKKAFAHAKCAENFFFYHDALSQMNNVATMQWMKFMGYHEHWILPELGCNANAVYHDHAVGNTPEVMPLDTSLFNDLDEAIDRHVVRSSRLAHADPKKFSMSTPARASSAFRRVWTGEPTSTRIKQDIGKLTCNMQQIVHHKGCVAPGLGNSGKRCNNECQKSSNWGGSRFKSKKTEK